jgi:ATP-dependent Clp protease ATP-binding subunit ClpA
MFDRFTNGARQVVVLAQHEARALGHDWIGTEHLLLGLAAESDGLAARVLDRAGVRLEDLRRAVTDRVGPGRAADAEALATIGIDLDAVRRAVEATFGEGALGRTRAGCIPFTPRAKRSLELALREALSLGHDAIGTEHLLLGLACGPGVARELLEERGLDYKRLRDLIVEALAAA